jgi:chromosome partitioning protein
MRVYAFANQKGGVGKTTTVVNLGAVLAEWGYRVLLIDIDPQSNATTSLGLNPRAQSASQRASTYDVLLDGQEIAAVARPTDAGLDLVPSTPALAGATVELNRIPEPRARAERLKQALADLTAYDYVLVDSPPSLGVLTVNALTAAQGVLVPVQCEYLALEGLSQLMRTISLVRRGLNARLALRGVVLTMYDSRTTLSRQVAEEVRAHFPDRVFDVIIPRSVRLSEAPSYGEPGVTYAPRSSGAVAYRVLAWELLRGDGYEPEWTPPA